jgi:hypothetical protein
MNAITAVKKTVAPIPTYLVCSPSEHPSSCDLSDPEQRRKNCFNIIDFDLLSLFINARVID